MGETRQSGLIDAAELAMFASPATALRYFSDQSSPVRVSSCTRPLSKRAAMAKAVQLDFVQPLRARRRLLDRLRKLRRNEPRKRDASARWSGLDGLRGRTVDETRHAGTQFRETSSRLKDEAAKASRACLRGQLLWRQSAALSARQRPEARPNLSYSIAYLHVTSSLG
jgi:hypothetical protein